MNIELAFKRGGDLWSARLPEVPVPTGPVSVAAYRAFARVAHQITDEMQAAEYAYYLLLEAQAIANNVILPDRIGGEL